MKWLILGAEGQLGRSMSQKLTEASAEFFALGRAQLDITDAKQINFAFENLKPDVVVNAAAWTNVDLAEDHQDEVHKVNSLAVGLLARECKNLGIKFFQISTDYVFSGESPLPWSETSETNPHTAYGRSKAEAERKVQEIYPDGSAIVRTAWLYGPYGRNFAKTMTSLALRDSASVDVVNDQYGQPTYSLDLANRIIQMAELENARGIFHGTNSGSASWFDFAREIFISLGQSPNRVLPISSTKLDRRARRPANSVLEHGRWNEIGLEPMRDWRLALSEAMTVIRASEDMRE